MGLPASLKKALTPIVGSALLFLILDLLAMWPEEAEVAYSNNNNNYLARDHGSSRLRLI